jgi:hypothetical protein
MLQVSFPSLILNNYLLLLLEEERWGREIEGVRDPQKEIHCQVPLVSRKKLTQSPVLSALA